MMEIIFFPKQRNLGSLSYSENASSISVKNLQDMDISNKVEIEASMQFRKEKKKLYCEPVYLWVEHALSFYGVRWPCLD